MPARKVDNSGLKEKLELRRWFLRERLDAPISVVDCCQGDGIIWGVLRQEFEVSSYWGMDLKKRKGRLRLDSTRYLSLGSLRENVIDIDTYGAPWDHWLALLPNVSRQTVVFLTIGEARMMGGNCVGETLASELGVNTLSMPLSLRGNLSKLAVPVMLGKAASYCNVVLVKEVRSSKKNMRYLGVELEPL